MFSISNFQNLMKGLPRGVFEKRVELSNADKFCKRFRHWDHLIAMVYAHLSEANCMVVLHDEQGSVAAGEMVDVILFEGLV